MSNRQDRNRAKNILARKKFHAEKEPEVTHGISLLDRRDDQCRWPLPAGGWCPDKRVDILKPYCDHHTKASLDAVKSVAMRKHLALMRRISIP